MAEKSGAERSDQAEVTRAAAICQGTRRPPRMTTPLPLPPRRPPPPAPSRRGMLRRPPRPRWGGC